MRSDVLEMTARQGLDVDAVRDLPTLELIDQARATLAAVERPGRRLRRRGPCAHHGDRARRRARGAFGGTRELLIALRRLRIGTGSSPATACAVRTVFPDLDQFVDAAISRELTPRVKPYPTISARRSPSSRSRRTIP